MEDLLKLPEVSFIYPSQPLCDLAHNSHVILFQGKLVTAKCKKSALKWLSSTSEEEGHGSGSGDQDDGAATERRMLLVDVDGKTASVMNISGNVAHWWQGCEL